ncbi:MAG: glycosyltransferase [Elusimicrobiota bacterium]
MSAPAAQKYVAHVIHDYLGHTVNWVYTQIKHTERYSPYILTSNTMNLEAYPVPMIFNSGDSLTYLRPLERFFRYVGALPIPERVCFSNVLKEKRPALIQAHFGWDGFFTLGLKKRFQLPLVTRFYGYDVGALPRTRFWKTRYLRLFEEGDLFIVEGQHMKSRVVALGCPPEKCIVHHLGIETDGIPYAPRKIADGVLKILIAATFKEKKGLAYALKALRLAIDSLSDLKVCATIIGRGPLKLELEKLAADLDIQKNIRWAGFQPHDEFIKALSGAHVFLSPSVTASDGDTEGGAPVALIEAQASGIPVVSTLHADIPEMVINEKTGILVPERNVEGLARAIVRIAKSASLMEGLGKAGREHVLENHDAARQGKCLADIYDGLNRF